MPTGTLSNKSPASSNPPNPNPANLEVDEKLLPFVIEGFGYRRWVYDLNISHGDGGAVHVFLKRDDQGGEEAKPPIYNASVNGL